MKETNERLRQIEIQRWVTMREILLDTIQSAEPPRPHMKEKDIRDETREMRFLTEYFTARK